MNITESLLERSESKCELCGGTDNFVQYSVPPESELSAEKCVMLCETCLSNLEGTNDAAINHWRCLSESMWSPFPAVQVMAWRLLTKLSAGQPWAEDLLATLYLDDETLAWAQSDDGQQENSASLHKADLHKDCNGVHLQNGDSVTLTKDLDVKGANFTAKRGTAVRGISLVADNPEQIEGRVNGQRIVILTKFVKKNS
ncbi:MAG: PhnA domain-containing protein [bacterium]|nr:PhnA domain-containing protein [bacterium]